MCAILIDSRKINPVLLTGCPSLSICCSLLMLMLGFSSSRSHQLSLRSSLTCQLMLHSTRQRVLQTFNQLTLTFQPTTTLAPQTQRTWPRRLRLVTSRLKDLSGTVTASYHSTIHCLELSRSGGAIAVSWYMTRRQYRHNPSLSDILPPATNYGCFRFYWWWCA